MNPPGLLIGIGRGIGAKVAGPSNPEPQPQPEPEPGPEGVSVETGPPEMSEKVLNTFMAILCDGIFTCVDEPTANKIIEDSLTLFNDDEEALAKVLELKILGKHTPFFYVIANRNCGQSTPSAGNSDPGMPPLLKRMLEICKELSMATQDDIMLALYLDSDNELFQTLRPYLPRFDVKPHKSFFNGEEDQATFTVTTLTSDTFKVAFKIPRFYDRLLIDSVISSYFLASGQRWTLEAVADGATWQFVLSEKGVGPVTGFFNPENGDKVYRTVKVIINPENQTLARLPFKTSYAIHEKGHNQAKIRLNGTDSQFYGTPLVSGKNREVSGEIEITSQVVNRFGARG
ncbi:hypothetical protein DFP72DRAFT_529422 [Ephemerocybe angulata]|uniref:Uncharacterized protein n=1 Tax=Ephemerocybe angulata TaxID=980116 RepID=A0A8H6IGC8_9AGAR|nr:hypothetical protein DFP72DRAFT_529422 [Tulosesus angulatus]